MRIGINLLSWVPGRRGGVETYDRNLLAALLQLDGPDEYVVFVGREAAGALGLADPRLREWGCPVTSARRVGRALWEQFRLTRELQRAQVEVLFCPHTLLPQRCPVPMVLMVHDLQVYDLPQYFPWLKRAYLYRRLPDSARRAHHLIANSEFTRQAVVHHLGQPPERVTVVLEAASAQFHPPGEGTVARVRKRWGLDRPYLLYLATSHRHKQMDRLVRVFDRLQQERGGAEQLVLGGLPGSGRRQLETALAQARHPEALRHLGRVPQQDLPALYTGARGLVFPSCYEGFGLPVLEAMACGCPVATSNRGALPEVAGEAALLFDPDSEQEMAQAMRRLVEEPGLAEELRRRGRAQAGRFTWEETARRTLQVLHEAGAGARTTDA